MNMSNIDRVLLEYLNEKYQVDKDSGLYKAACLLLQRLWQGSICISLEDLHEKISGFNQQSLKSPAVGKCSENRPLIFDGEYLYIQRYYIYQKRILGKIEQLCKNNNFHIITGGPGTGKTTSLAGTLKNWLDKKILLAAPTGKAAFRMKESLLKQNINLDAKTIHRLLGTIHLSINFKHNKDNPLSADIIAIDESSMIDLPMMVKLLDAVPDNCRLYLLGDKNQLSPVEAGTVFADICRKYQGNNDVYTELTKNYRTESPGILKLSAQILNGNINDLSNENVNYYGQLSFKDLYAKYDNVLKVNNEKDALDALQKFQVLCAVKSGRNGTVNINNELMERAKKENTYFTPIIITENNYLQNLFNGDAGVKDREKAYFLNGNEIKTYPLLTLPSYDNAFAITIHKSQGSEYDCVAVVYPDSKNENEENTIFTRELLYTAVTRAKKECLIYGSKEALIKSCKRQIHRASGIK